MEIVILNDGTVLENAYLVPDGQRLWFYVQNGMNLCEVFELMSDPEKTRVITGVQYGTEKQFEGYIDLASIRRDGTEISGSLMQMEVNGGENNE